MPPPATGSGASRVHNTTLVWSGSPEATPSVNGSPDSSNGASVELVVVGCTVVVAAAVVGVRLVGGTVAAFDVAACSPSLSEHAATTAAAPIAKNTRRDTGPMDAVCRIVPNAPATSQRRRRRTLRPWSRRHRL